VLMAAIRDEELSRRADPVAQWWPADYPTIIGGRDERAGGTWLAVDPSDGAVATVFTNGISRDATLPSRGELPLIAIRERGDLSRVYERYAAFALLYASKELAVWWQWNAASASTIRLDPGFHSASFEGVDAPDLSTRQARWTPRFRSGSPISLGARNIVDRWGGWARLVSAGAEPERRDALIRLHTNSPREYGTKSVALIALGLNATRFDVLEDPIGVRQWRSVLAG
jgi:hypothetical protein